MKHFRKAVLIAFTLVATVAASSGSAEQGVPRLDTDQETMARRIDGMLMAPCCFANTLAEHHSPAADELRQEVRSMVASGASESQITDAMVAKYGERILAAPAAQGFNLLAYILPIFVVVAGFVIIAVVLRRWRKPRSPGLTSPPVEVSEQLEARFEAELARFDERRSN